MSDNMLKSAEDITQKEEADIKEIDSSVQNAIKKIQTNPPLQKFRTADGPFGWFAHGVTGEELNRFVNDIQKHLIESHESHIDLQEKYEQMIWDLGGFDKKYLEENIKAVKASEKACQEAREVRKELETLKNDNVSLKKRLRLAYVLAGISTLIAIAALILHFVISLN